MIISSYIILIIFGFCMASNAFPARKKWKATPKSKSGLGEFIPMSPIEIFLHNTGTKRYYTRIMGCKYNDDGSMSIKTPWYLRHFVSMSFKNGEPIWKPKWRNVIVLFLIVLAITVLGISTGVWFFILGAAFTDKATGDFDAVGQTTWNELGFPATGDTVTINSFIVSVKGPQACGNVTIGASGTLRFDGQSDATPAIMNLDNGATLANSGTVDQTGTGSTGYASLAGVSAEPMTGTAPSLGNGYWKVDEIDFQMDITTGGSSCTFEFIGDCTIDAITVTANDTLKCITNNVTITGDNSKDFYVDGIFEIAGASGQVITIAGPQNVGARTGSTVNIDYLTTSTLNNGFILTGTITYTLMDHCSFSGTTYAGLFVDTTLGQFPTISNSIFSGGDNSAWSKCDVRIFTGVNCQLDTCTYTTVGLEGTSGWLVSKDASSNFTIYGILASSETPSAGYRAADITGDLTLSQADAYGSSFNTSYTLGANCVNVDNLTVDASTTFDTSGTNYNLSCSVELLVNGTLNLNSSTIAITDETTVNGGTIDCDASTCTFGSAVTGTEWGLIIIAGVFIGGSGNHILDSFAISGGSAVFTSGTTDINNARVDGLSFDWFAGNWDDGNGTLKFSFNGTQYIYKNDNASVTFFNLIVDSTAGTLQYYNGNGFPLVVANNLTITSGTFDTSETVSGTSRDLTVTGTTSIAGTLTGNASAILHTGNLMINAGGVYTATSATTTCTGDIDNQNTFTHSSGAFVMNGTTQSLTGSWTFWHFTKSVAAADTLTFDNTATYTFGGNVTLNGASGQLLTMQSDSAGDAFNFVMSAGAVKTNLSFLSVIDSDASGSDSSQTPIGPTDSIDAGNNIDWFASEGNNAPFKNSMFKTSQFHNGKVGRIN